VKSKWTFMVYMAGNNSLSGAASSDLSEMRKVGSTPEVSLLAFIKQRGAASARYLKVQKGGLNETVASIGDVDSGSPQTLVDFVRWGVATAPADRYALVLWNHGGGWEPDDMDALYSSVKRGNAVSHRELNLRSTQRLARSFFSTTVVEILSRPTAGERQICNDDGTGHSLDTLELGNVIKAAAKEMGHDVDVVGMDACLMSDLEVAYQIRNEARVIVGSEELEPGAGWPYDQVLAKLVAEPAMSATDLAEIVVDRYSASYAKHSSVWPVTQTALVTKETKPLASAVDALERALRTQLKSGWTEVFRAQLRSVRFDADLVDLSSFCRALGDSTLDSKTKEAAAGVVDALQPGGFVLAESHLGKSVEDVGGVSVYLPPPTGSISRYYKDLSFAKTHRWDEFLASYQKAAKS
jgi:cysteine peptidase C11 family protein